MILHKCKMKITKISQNKKGVPIDRDAFLKGNDFTSLHQA